jgi:methylmalonyl-CoA mutase N-terminal domain/subunit
LQALAAVLGGTQSLHTNSRDEALALPSADSVRLALRTQQIIASESGVADIVDPLGGSWAVEQLTDELEADALRLIAEVDEMGGMIAAIEEGFPQREIQNSAYQAQLATDHLEQEVVGVNVHTEGHTPPTDLLRVDPAIENEQVERLAQVRESRDSAAADAAIDAVQNAAAGTENLMPLIVDAVRVRCTLGEIADSLRGVFGEYQESVVI